MCYNDSLINVDVVGFIYCPTAEHFSMQSSPSTGISLINLKDWFEREMSNDPWAETLNYWFKAYKIFLTQQEGCKKFKRSMIISLKPRS